MRVEIINNINHFPQFEAQNVFQTKDYMRLFEHEKGTKVVIFAVYFGSSLLLLQPLTIIRYYRHLPSKFASYAVAWREPWRAQNITDEEAIKAFELMNEAIVKYCRKRALYVEYRHFGQCSIYNSQLTTFQPLPWYNIYRRFEVGADVAQQMNKTKQRQLRQSLSAGVAVEFNPTDEQIIEWYALLRRLYRRIHRPLPSCQLFLRLNKSGVGKLFVVTYQGKVVSGSALLVFKCNSSQHVYEFYRASTPDKLQGIYPSVVATWQELQFASIQGAQFDFMGAGPQNKPYGVRDFKLTFGGELTKEYRYRKYLLL
jgi:hypothetical protein